MRTPALTTLILGLLLVGPALVAEPAAQASIVTPSFQVYAAPSSLANSDNAGEPSIGVDRATGAALYQAYTSTYKVTWDASGAATWRAATPTGSVFNLDPILATDAATGRTWAGGLEGSCSLLWHSDNDGASWTPNGNTCSGTIDHETIGSGPWAGGQPLGATYSRAVYYCAQVSSDACSTSSDGGVTFANPVPVLGACGSLHGHVKVAADGVAYLPNAHCGGPAGGGITTNNGLTWSSYTIAGSSAEQNGFDPSVGVTTSGSIYEAWEGTDHHTYVAKSTTHGSSWTTPVDVSGPAGLPTTTFQAAVAGDDARVAVAFLGSTTTGNPYDSRFTGTWDLYVAYSYDSGASWTVVKATSDPVQRGWICSGGTGCGSGRNLLDFIDASVDAQGRVYVAFADGCIGACAGPSGTASQSTDAYATIARQSGGSGVFAASDPSGPGVPAAPTLTATAGINQVALSWTTPADGGAAITGYHLYRNGALYQSLGVVTSYTDTAVTAGTAYSYQVAAVNSVGEGTKSNTATATPFSNTAPNAPTGLAASHSGSPKSGKIALSWSAPSANGGPAVTGYKLYRGTSPGAETFLVSVGNVLSYTDTGLTQGTTYYYKVSAVNSVGESGLSNEASASG